MKTEWRGPRGVEQERARTGVARCACRGLLGFTTDHLGRALESCNACGYHGPIRTPKAPTPKPTRADYFRERHQAKKAWKADPHQFRCGHPRSTENTYQHPCGWGECRECARQRSRRAS
jgi:hypothetical protein